jgi:hypothetical protein
MSGAYFDEQLTGGTRAEVTTIAHAYREDPPAPDVVTPVAKILDGIRECLCEAFASAGCPVCCCMWWPGDQRPPMVGCDCCPDSRGEGFAWVRYMRESELLATPTARKGFGGGEACLNAGGRLQLTIEAGVYRCVSLPEPDDNSANCAMWTAQARDRELDKATIHAALVCCSATAGRQVTLFTTSMIGPSGGCAGSSVTVNIDLG